MLELGENPTLCRNGKRLYVKSDTATVSKFSSKKNDICICCPLDLEEGIFMSELQNEWLRTDVVYEYAERRARLLAAGFVGSLAVGAETVLEPLQQDTNTSTLLYAVQMASLGDTLSERMLETNVTTDIAERLFKAGHQTEVELQYYSSALYQNGRKLTDVLANTFKYATLNSIMYRRSMHDITNGFLFNDLISEGILETHHVLVFSQATKDLATSKDYNFYKATDTCSVQMLLSKNNKIYLQTALVAGKKSASATRHDSEAIMAVAKQNGTQMNITDVDDTARTVLLVPKANINGIEDIVAQYDKAAGDTFYGQDVHQQNYQQYASECYKRDFSQITSAVKAQLLAEAHLFTSAIEVIERLDYLSERLSVQQSVQDKTILSDVFGPLAARHIEDARKYLEIGDTARAQVAMRKAQDSADSSSCPLFKRNGQAEGQNSDNKVSKSKFMNCPHCKARVYDDPCATFLKCWDCKASALFGQSFKGNKKTKNEQFLLAA